MTPYPTIDDAPGIAWRKLKHGWEARWRARSDLVLRGYTPKGVRLWAPTKDMNDPSAVAKAWIAQRCRALQDEMLKWGRGGAPEVMEFDGTLGGLIVCYQRDPDSSYRDLRYVSRVSTDGLLKRIDRDYGRVRIEQIKAREVKRWHEGWLGPTEPKKVVMAHGFVTQLRTLLTFGSTILDDKVCREAKAILGDMKFEMGKTGTAAVTAAQVIAHRARSHSLGLHAMAFGEACQFEGMLRQKDVIGEWVPLSEPGLSDIMAGNEKSIRGIRWENLDQHLVLKHVTSKRQKEIAIDFKLAPMIMEELSLLCGGAVVRNKLPASGPMIVSEDTGRPYRNSNYRREWRKVAKLCGIPDNVKNMHNRAGGISEATDAGAPLEHVRHAATHSDIATTQIYSRNQTDKTANVARLRVEHRNKTSTKVV